MKILVTGGAGYVGSHAVYGLIDKGYEVVVVDNLQTGFKDAIHAEAKFYEGDIRDTAFLDGVFENERIDGVIHFAANSLVGESMEKPLDYFDNNVHGTQKLLESMIRFDVKNIVFSSTAATYGEPIEVPITEEHVTNPINAYGETKRVMEKLMHWASEAHKLNYISLRYFNVAGAHSSGEIGESHNPETHLIPIILQVPLGRRDYLSIFGDDYSTEDGTCIRDYIHIEDLIDAHILAMKKLLDGGECGIYNLGTGTGYSINQMLEAARKVTGHPIPAKVAERRAGDPAVLVASNKLAKEQLGWSPKWTKVEDIIESAWKFYEKRPFGFNRSE
jgi:UDP-glucose 4-epimerase